MSLDVTSRDGVACPLSITISWTASRLNVEDKAAQYARLLRDLPVGLSEWAVHPGLGNEEAQAIDPDGWHVRRTDYEFLTSPEARELLRQEQIIVIDYRAIQHAWSQASAPVDRQTTNELTERWRGPR